MPTRGMRPEDLKLMRWAADAHLSPDAERVAWCETWLDEASDEPRSAVMVARASGGAAPRRFSDGPHDFSPRWSPDGRHLAYLSASSGPPALRLAPLDGGTPRAVTSPGPVRFAQWSPTGDRLVLVVGVGGHAGGGEEDDPKRRNAARAVRGSYNRLDGAGWLEGRDHLFVYRVDDESLVQVSSGDYDHAQPSWSPDGTSLVFVSDRSRLRDDKPAWGGIWVMGAAGGRPRPVVERVAFAAFPTFSPDGTRVAFTGFWGGEDRAGRDSRLYVVEVGAPAASGRRTGGPAPEQVVPDLDRPVGFTWASPPLAWLSPDELLFTYADRGTVGIRSARLGERTGRVVVGGETQVAGLSVAGPAGREVLAYATSWVDAPGEVFCTAVSPRRRAPVQVSRAGEELLAAVRLLPAERFTTRAPDGMEVEYLALRPPAGGARRGRSTPPMILEIHGGPNLHNPICEILAWYQILAGAGYAVVLPNPRGSIGYGEDVTRRSVGDWGGEDYADLMACADDAVGRGIGDAGRQFVTGYSYGGYMSSWIVGHTNRFRAAAIGAPVTNLSSMFGTSDADGFFAEALAGDPWSSSDHYAARSPVRFVREVSTPVFLYVNDGDLRCPPSQADELFVGLKWFGKEVEYVRYPGGSHASVFTMLAAPSQTEDRARRVLDFFARHGGASAQRPAPPSGSSRRNTRRLPQPSASSSAKRPERSASR